MTHLRGTVSGKYEVTKLLGRGGMGAVFHATEHALDRPVAIKVLPPELSHDEKFVQRFQHEARTAAKLDHPNIIPIFAVESQADLHFFVMKYITGRGLDEILEAGPMPLDAVRRILWEAACALGHAHQRGIVHRDIKPANIMVDDAGRTMLTDFGISKALQSASQFTATGQVIGTPHYMSPEQAKGQEVDGRSDQYSLAVVGYRMLSGRLPFDDDSVHTVIYKHIFEDPPALKDLRKDAPEFLTNALHKAMAKNPADRFANMEEFASAVWPEQKVATPAASGVAAASAASIDAATEITPPSQPVRRRRRGIGVLFAVLLIGGGGVGGWWLWNNSRGAVARPGTGEDQPATAAAVVPDSQPAAAAPETTVTDTATPVATPPVQAPAQPATQRPAQTEPPRTQPTRQPQPQPARPSVGRLTINAVPVYATVYIDNVEIGDTPLINHELPPGRYVIELRREGWRTVVDTITITAGNPLRLTKTLTREGS